MPSCTSNLIPIKTNKQTISNITFATVSLIHNQAGINIELYCKSLEFKWLQMNDLCKTCTKPITCTMRLYALHGLPPPPPGKKCSMINALYLINWKKKTSYYFPNSTYVIYRAGDSMNPEAFFFFFILYLFENVISNANNWISNPSAFWFACMYDTAFFSKWNRALRVRHPNIWYVIRRIKTEGEITKQKMRRVNRGDRRPRRKLKWRQLEQRIKRLKRKLRRGRINLGRYWRATVYVTKAYA